MLIGPDMSFIDLHELTMHLGGLALEHITAKLNRKIDGEAYRTFFVFWSSGADSRTVSLS